jgi:protein SCO1/2
MRRVWAAIAAVLLAVTACSSAAAHPEPATQSGLVVGPATVGNFDGFGMVPPRPRPAFVLTDTSGKRFDFAKQTAGKPTFLFFGYTHCEDVCPETLADIAVTLRKLPAAISRQVVVAFVTTDVKRDTGPVIARWLANFDRGVKGATFVGLRGTQAQIDAAQAAAHVFLATDGGQTHSAQVLLYGPDDYARVSFTSTRFEQREMEHDLPLVLNRS